MYKKVFIGILAIFISSHTLVGQQVNTGGDQSTGQQTSSTYNVITTAVPFMTITPDSRAGAMGGVGAATKTDVWSQHWNASKYALAEKEISFGISYTPWLENLGIKDIDLIYLAGYKKLDDRQAFGASLRYFSMGEIPAYDDEGNSMGFDLSPKEYAVDVSYSRYLSDFFVMGMTFRYIHSNLGGDIDPDYKPGKAGAGDVSGTYFKDITIGELESDLQIGLSISNLGSKITYSSNQKDFIPTNLRLGFGLDTELDKFNSIGVYLDFNKLLVPTPQYIIPSTDEAGNDNSYLSGPDPSKMSTTQGIFNSFNDAPGGFSEEMAEIIVNFGLEYWYNQQFAIRGGYFHEAATKGNRKYFTLGAGLRLNVFGLDFAYLIPTQGTSSPLANTFRFSLIFDFEGLSVESKDSMEK